MNAQDITIRTTLQAGDLGYVIHRHGALYSKEYGYGIGFEAYVAEGILELYNHYDADKDCVWICEHHNIIVGFLALQHKTEDTAQLRYFYLEPAYRGIGLGKLLLQLFIDFYKAKRYQRAFLWTTSDLTAAASLYQRHGFRLSEEVEQNTFGKRVTGQRYELRIHRTADPE